MYIVAGARHLPSKSISTGGRGEYLVFLLFHVLLPNH